MAPVWAMSLVPGGGAVVADIIEKTQTIQWHPGFVAGLEISLRKFKSDLQFYPEWELSKAPLSADQLSVTLVQHGKPGKLFRDLERLGSPVTQGPCGVYTIQDLFHFPIQIVVSSQLEGEEFASLWILSKSPGEKDIKTFLAQSEQFTEKGDIDNSDAVLQVSIAANTAIYDTMRRGNSDMCDALRQLMQPEIDKMINEAVEKAVEKANQEVAKANQEAAEANREAAIREELNMLNNIRNVIEGFKVTAQQAMDVLKISPADQAKYTSML